MTEELKQKAEEYAEKNCKNCNYRCDKPNMFKRVSNKIRCHAYFRSYEAYIAGYNKAQNTITQCNRSALSGVKWHKVADAEAEIAKE